MTARIEDDGPVRIVTIDRPGARNAVDRPTADALEDASCDLDVHAGVAVGVLTGAGGTFCAGADLHGHAVGGGLELAVWCDLRVVAADAVSGVFSRRWGVPLIDGGTVRLPG